MRTDLILGAQAYVKNRYLLCQLATKATGELHKSNTRLQDTINDVLIRLEHDVSPQLYRGIIAVQDQSEELIDLAMKMAMAEEVQRESVFHAKPGVLAQSVSRAASL